MATTYWRRWRSDNMEELCMQAGADGRARIQKGGRLIAEMNMLPEITMEGEALPAGGFRLTSFEQENGTERYRYTGGSVSVCVQIQRERCGWRIATQYAGNGVIDRARCLVGRFFRESSDEKCELFTYSPDLNRSLLPKQGKTSFSLSSLELRSDDSFARGDGGRFIIPPYYANLRIGDCVLGFGCLTHSRAIQGLEPTVCDDTFWMQYDYQGQMRLCEEGTAGETFFLCACDSYEEGLKNYLSALRAYRQSGEKYAAWQDFWSGPVYCTIGDQAYQAMLDTGSIAEKNFDFYATQDFTQKMLDLADSKGLRFKMLIIDAGWMKSVGLWDCHTGRFPDMRAFIDEQRKKGLHVVLWYTPYDTQFNGVCEYIEREHPDWRLKNKKGETRQLLDYTNPAVRDFVAERIRYLLSDEEGCLNADGLKVDFYYHLYDESGFSFYDPAYGSGELLQYKVLKHIYDCCKRVKPQAYIEGSSANPMFNDTQDACRLNDDVTGDQKTYLKRAWIVSQTDCGVADTDDWWSYKDYFTELTLKKCALGIPAIYAVKYRGTQGHMLFGYSGVAPGGNPVAISEHEYRQLSAILRVYDAAPIDRNQKVIADLQHEKYMRGYERNGEFAVAAQTLNRGAALVAYGNECALCCSLENALVSLPLPAGAESVAITEQTEKGERPVASEIRGNHILFDAQDCGSNGAVYKICWKVEA